MLLSLAVALTFCGCQDTWDDEDVSGSRSLTLWDVISTRSELSSFATVLKNNGYDQVLASSGTYTVLAPTNSAMSNIPDSLKATVPATHIALLEYNKSELDTMTYLTMMNNKMIVVDSLKLTSEEIVCRNGVLRFATYGYAEVPNIYEHLLGLRSTNKMADFIISLGDSVMDMELSQQVGIDEFNNVVYDTVMKYYNPLFDYVPLNDNDSLVSLVLLEDATFDALVAKYWPYLRQHNGVNRDPMAQVNKIDSAATTYTARFEVCRDMVCYLSNAQAGSDYVSTEGVVLTMDTATVSKVISAANGNIQVASGVGIRIKDNKVKDVYVEAEDYYITNEAYTHTRVNIHARGGYDVVVTGADTVTRYYQLLPVTTVTAEGDTVIRDSIVLKSQTEVLPLSTTQVNFSAGGSYIGLKANLFACKYKIYMRSVDDIASHYNPDTLALDYALWKDSVLAVDSFRVNPNYPIGGVNRHVQKMYISQPGDYPLEFNNSPTAGGFVLNCYPNNPYSGTYKNYRCMAPFDPAAITLNAKGVRDYSAVGAASNFARLGINAGFAVDDYTYESPMIWCQTAVPGTSVDASTTTGTAYYTGIVGVLTNEQERYNARTGNPILVPNDIFLNGFAGEATVFVTNAAFNTGNSSSGSSNSRQPHGCILLDYIHFVPQIDE